MSRYFIGQILLVGFGGFIGSGLRFAMSGWVQRLFPMSAFPWGTLAVNVCGCLAIGFLGGIADMRQAFEPGQRLFLFIGVLGGFTTFSTYAFETFALAQDSEVLKAGLNTILQVVLGLGAAWAGYAGARML